MVYRVIDDETALAVYDAIQKQSKRDFAQYGGNKRLPDTPISGELSYFLDEIVEFAETKLNRSASETLSAVIDAGIISWYGSLERDHQKQLGHVMTPDDDRSDDDALRDEVAALKAAQGSLRAELTRLQIENEELYDRLDPGDKDRAPDLPPYLNNEPEQSSYTEMTSHVLGGKGNGGAVNGREAAKAAPKRIKNKRPSRRHR